MAGVKGAKLERRALVGAPRKHYCPTCVGDAEVLTQEMEAKPVMMMPGRHLFYDCKAGHRNKRSGVILA